MDQEITERVTTQSERRPVGRRRSRGRKAFALCVGGAAMLCLFGLMVTWARLAVVDRAYQLGRERAHNEQLLRERAKLSLEIEAQQTARKVETAAHAMGMMKADRVLVVSTPLAAANAKVSEGALASNGF